MKFLTIACVLLIATEFSLALPSQSLEEIQDSTAAEGSKRSKRGCGKKFLPTWIGRFYFNFIIACGPNGCLCNLEFVDESFQKVFADEIDSDVVKRLKRGGCCEFQLFYNAD